MTNHGSGTQKYQNSTIDVDKSIWVDGSRERQSLEISRRIKELQIRRDFLEKELQSVRNCLIALDGHMQNDSAYKKLVLGN